MKVYFAAPLDSEDCRTKNEEYAATLRSLNLDVYMPHEHGVGDLLVAEGADRAQAFKALYEGDMFGLQTCDFVVAISTKEDRHLSAGLLWEIGWATGNGKPVYLITQGSEQNYSLMVTHSVSKSFDTWTGFLNWLKASLRGYTKC